VARFALRHHEVEEAQAHNLGVNRDAPTAGARLDLLPVPRFDGEKVHAVLSADVCRP
jgi:hypothetical protein